MCPVLLNIHIRDNKSEIISHELSYNDDPIKKASGRIFFLHLMLEYLYIETLKTL